MRVCVYEDCGVVRLDAVALTRPACDLWCGATTLLEKQAHHFGVAGVGLLVRPLLAAWSRRLHPGLPVNDPGWLAAGPLLPVNARWLPPPAGPEVGLADGKVAYVALPDPRPLPAPGGLDGRPRRGPVRRVPPPRGRQAGAGVG